MSKINLLPWREELKKIKNKIFYSVLGCCIFFSALFTLFVDRYLNYKIAVENANIQYINKELQQAKEKIVEVQSLKRNKKEFLERMNIIQSLQADRPSAVKLLDMLPRVLPEGLYLVDLSRKNVIAMIDAIALHEQEKENGSTINKMEQSIKKYSVIIQGVALTNGSISVLLKNLEKIKWISAVKLNEVSINKDGDGLNFNLSFMQNLTEEG